MDDSGQNKITSSRCSNTNGYYNLLWSCLEHRDINLIYVDVVLFVRTKRRSRKRVGLIVRLARPMLDHEFKTGKVLRTTLYALQRGMFQGLVVFKDERQRLMVSLEDKLSVNDILTKAAKSLYDGKRLAFHLRVALLGSLKCS